MLAGRPTKPKHSVHDIASKSNLRDQMFIFSDSTIVTLFMDTSGRARNIQHLATEIVFNGTTTSRIKCWILCLPLQHQHPHASCSCPCALGLPRLLLSFLFQLALVTQLSSLLPFQERPDWLLGCCCSLVLAPRQGLDDGWIPGCLAEHSWISILSGCVCD